MRVRELLALLGGLLGGFLSACSPAAMGPVTVFADPGKYQYHTCKQLADPHKRAMKREQELKLLMDKAAQSTGGGFVNVIAYNGDYQAAREELKVIEATARAKNCDPSWPQESEQHDEAEQSERHK